MEARFSFLWKMPRQLREEEHMRQEYQNIGYSREEASEEVSLLLGGRARVGI